MSYAAIVVGTDGSPTATRAVREAGALAKSHQARLIIATAYASEPADGMSRLAGTPATSVATRQRGAPADLAWTLTDRGQAEGLARAGRKIAIEEGGAQRVSITSGAGEPADVLLEAVELFGADLIVVGSVGLTGPRRLLGSVAAAVLHHAPCDVLVVRTTE